MSSSIRMFPVSQPCRPSSSKLVLYRASVSAVVASILILVSGCGGADRYAVDKSRVASRIYSTEKKVPHPDSLEDVFVIRRPSTGGRDSIGFKQEADLQSLLEKWSSAAGPNRYYNRESHFATLRSKELALAHVSERAGSTLSDSVPPGGTKARSDSSTAIADQLESYRETVCINVYLFGLTSKPFTDNPPDATQLQIGDQVIRPTERRYSARRPTYLPDGKTTYQRLTLVFPRVVGGTDILKRSAGINLELPGMRFSWTWEEDVDQGFGRRSWSQRPSQK